MSKGRLLLLALILSFQCNLLRAQTGVTYTLEDPHRHFQNEAESYEILGKGETQPFNLKLNQAPNASEPYFSFKPPVTLPAPEQLR